MTLNDKNTLVRLLTEYHGEQKAMAQGLVELKICEEAAEVIINDLQGLRTTEEEADLLMCLVQVHLSKTHAGILSWMKKMKDRNRDVLPEQESFLAFWRQVTNR